MHYTSKQYSILLLFGSLALIMLIQALQGIFGPRYESWCEASKAKAGYAFWLHDEPCTIVE
jgi:hypothetical protein